MKKIDISNQNRDLFYHPTKHIWFESVNDNTYTIHTDLDYLLEYACMNYDPLPLDAEDFDFESTDQYGNKHKGRIHSFDPSGGPYMAVGDYTINGKVVNRIYQNNKNTYFEVKNEK